MTSCLHPVWRSARGQRIWPAYRKRAEKLNAGTVNPLLTRYIELVALQERLSSVLIGSLDVPDIDSDRALLSYFNGEELRPLLALAERELRVKGQMEPQDESLNLLEELWNQVEEFQVPSGRCGATCSGSLCDRALRLATPGDGNNTRSLSALRLSNPLFDCARRGNGQAPICSVFSLLKRMAGCASRVSALRRAGSVQAPGLQLRCLGAYSSRGL